MSRSSFFLVICVWLVVLTTALQPATTSGSPKTDVFQAIWESTPKGNDLPTKSDNFISDNVLEEVPILQAKSELIEKPTRRRLLRSQANQWR